MPEKSTPNWVLILVALIGMTGAIIAATIQSLSSDSGPAKAVGQDLLATSSPISDVQPPPGADLDLSGAWYVQTRTDETSYEKYEGLIVRYKVLITQVDGAIDAKGEKIGEVVRGTVAEYSGKAKTPISLTGFLRKTEAGTTQVLFSGQEGSSSRTAYATSFTLDLTNDGLLLGRFVSTAADAKGAATWIPEEVWLRSGWGDL